MYFYQIKGFHDFEANTLKKKIGNETNVDFNFSFWTCVAKQKQEMLRQLSAIFLRNYPINNLTKRRTKYKSLEIFV